MAAMPAPVAALLDAALVAELTVVDGARPARHLPAHPAVRRRADLHDVVELFCRKLEHIKANPKVSRVDHRSGRGRRPARPGHDPGRRPGHRGRPARRLGALLPIWEAKEPSSSRFLKERFALPLFFERALIEITPRRVLYWATVTATAPVVRRGRTEEAA